MNTGTGRIERVKAREVIDSRGNPTEEVEMVLVGGSAGIASVPSGASMGKHEAVELRDGHMNRYGGLGVLRAVENVNRGIGPELVGMSVLGQTAIDGRLIELDGTADKSNLGANAILEVSWNVMNGGKHAPDSADFQEFMVVPADADNYGRAMQMGIEFYHCL